MPTEIKMPQLGESITEGLLSRWLKVEGERVEPDELLFEVETDKINSEIPAPAGGILLQILIPEGQTVPVGTVLALVGEEVSASPPVAGGGPGGGWVPLRGRPGRGWIPLRES